jgi:hypothetical protein
MDGTARVVDDVGGGGVRKELKCAGDMARVSVLPRQALHTLFSEALLGCKQEIRREHAIFRIPCSFVTSPLTIVDLCAAT